MDGAMSTADRAQAAEEAATVEAALPLLGLRITAGPIELRGITDDLLGPLADLAVEGISSPGGPPFLTRGKPSRRRTCLVSSLSTTGSCVLNSPPTGGRLRWPCSGTASLPESRNSLATSTW